MRRDAAASAEAIAKSHGVEVLASNHGAGREFLSVNAGGNSEALEALKRDLEKAGWHAWPQDEASEGYFMDFSLYEPPPNAKTENAGITVDDQPPEVVSAGSTFRYFGPSNLFLNNMLFVALITVVFLAAKGTPDEFRIVIASGVFLGLSALFALWNWVDVTADSDKLVVREYIWRRPRDIRYGEINSVKIYAEKDRGSVTRFLGFNLKRGKNFDLALPDKRQAELLMFVKTRLRK